MWSLGVTFADFFRPLEQQLDDAEWGDDLEEEAEEDEQHICQPFILSQDTSTSRVTSWRRLPLFDADKGDIGLAWSIFKVKGTPNETNWPVNQWTLARIRPPDTSVRTSRPCLMLNS